MHTIYYKYIHNINNSDIYKNFYIITLNNFNSKINSQYISYDDINYIITIYLNNNDYIPYFDYHYKNNNHILGKFIFGIYYYYNIHKSIIINTDYIDNINSNTLNTYNNIDFNLIQSIHISDNFYSFNILLKNNTISSINKYIIPFYNYSFLDHNVIKNTNLLKLKKFHFKLHIYDDNFIAISDFSPYLNKYSIITFLNNVPNTNIISIIHIIFIKLFIILILLKLKFPINFNIIIFIKILI